MTMTTFFEDLLKRAKAGDTDAQMAVAEIYFKGKGVLPSALEALYWLEKAAPNNKYASIQIANMYLNGYGVPQDVKKAFDVTYKYANKNNEIQMFNLAGYYLHGVGTVKDVYEAISWYKKAYQNNHYEAAYYLGFIYQTIDEVKNLEEAIKWYEIAVEYNNGRAAYNLAYLYLDGSVVAKDNDKALEYANKALSLGVNEAEQLIEQIEKNKDGYFGYSAYR